VRSKELEGKYGEAPVARLFDYGKGEVFHDLALLSSLRSTLAFLPSFFPRSSWESKMRQTQSTLEVIRAWKAKAVGLGACVAGVLQLTDEADPAARIAESKRGDPARGRVR
jgi:hypothetical protein